MDKSFASEIDKIHTNVTEVSQDLHTMTSRLGTSEQNITCMKRWKTTLEK